ncbi:MAG: hypothetical protein J5903_01255, partial [Clostridia bacterium]|nr:hypothetical protein [Clostridia bacterium]
MKKKIISLIVGILSVFAALVLATVTLYCIVKISDTARVIKDTTDDLWGIELIAYAGLTYVLAVLGIIISGALACYRATLAYYYIKLFSSSDGFYSERTKGLIGFSFLSGIMCGAYTVAAWVLHGKISEKIYIFAVIMAALYSLLTLLPLIERIIFSFVSKRKPRKAVVVAAPTKEKIAEELDEDAESLAESVYEEKTAKTATPETQAEKEETPPETPRTETKREEEDTAR